MPNKHVGWGEERTPTNAGPASPQPTSTIPDLWLNIALGDAIDYGKTIKAEPSEIDDNTWVLELEDIEKTPQKFFNV